MTPVAADTRRRVAFTVVLVAAALVVSLYVIGRRPEPSLDPLLTAGLGFAFFVARLLPIRLPQGDEVCVSLMVGVCAIGVMDVGAAAVAAVAAGLVDAAARFQQSSVDVTLGRALDALRAAALIGMLSPWQILLHPQVQSTGMTDSVVVGTLLAGSCYAALDLITLAINQRLLGGLPVVPGVLALARPLRSVYLVHLAMAAVVLRVYPFLGIRALLIALLLTLILQNSFNLYLRIRRAYAETIGALARAAELDRPEDSGHAQRVADLAVAVGRQMGLSSHDLELIDYAALLHDIGRIGYSADLQDVGHASRGAEIVARIPFLADVAPLIEAHHEASGVSLGSTIVGLCSDYDRLRRESGAEAALQSLLEDATGVRRDVVEVVQQVARTPRLRGKQAR